MVLGEESIELLGKKRVAVFGLGGVGGSAAETLARAGVGEFDLIDNDAFGLSNLNRQTLSSHGCLGRRKVDVAAERILSINPNAVVHKHQCFYSPENQGGIDFGRFDYVLDAIDTVSSKLLIIEQAASFGIPVLSALGCGNRIDPTKLRICDIFDTEGDPLARVLRRELRRKSIKHLKVVCSSEQPRAPKIAPQEPLPPGKKSIPGSTSFVPPTAGILMAYQACADLCGWNQKA